MPACGDNPEYGYTSAYAPEASSSLDEPYDATLITGDNVDLLDTDFSMDCSLYLGE